MSAPKVTGLDTPEQAVAALEAVVKGREDFVYESPIANELHGSAPCVYVFDGRPSCLIGHVLVSCGLSVTDERFDQNDVANDLAADLGLSDGVGWILRTAQEIQDDRRPWKEALEVARQIATDWIEAQA